MSEQDPNQFYARDLKGYNKSTSTTQNSYLDFTQKTVDALNELVPIFRHNKF